MPACREELSVSSTPVSNTNVQAVESGTDPSIGESAPADPIDGGELETGTITGNPVPKPIKQLILKTVNTPPQTALQSTSTAPTKSPNDATNATVQDAQKPLDTSSYCKQFSYKGIQFPGALSCRVTPSHYNLGVREIAFASCTNVSSSEIACADHSATSAANGLSILKTDEGTIHRLEIDDTGMNVEFDLGEGVGIRAGGINFTVTYIEQTLPDDAVNPVEAAKIIPELKGKSYRICTASQDAGPEAMTIYCGQAESRMGDVLWDMNGDGSFGFMQPQKGDFTESATRPDKYEGMNLMRSLRHVTATELDPLIPGDPYLPLLAAFDTIQDVPAEADFTATLSFNVAGTFRFVDGYVKIMKCVLSKDPDSCMSEHNDPLTPGWYHPRYDGLLPELPDIESTF